MSGEEFQVWRMRVDSKRAAELTCEDGDDRVVWREQILWTDFPLDEIKFFVRERVIMLPSEC